MNVNNTFEEFDRRVDRGQIGWIYVSGEPRFFGRFFETLCKAEPAFARRAGMTLAGEEMVAVLCHLDVVPEGDGWTVPPYEGRVIDGKIYGRGTMDDKGPSVAALFALKVLKDAGVPLKRRVRILFGLNEEMGSADMKYYLSHGARCPLWALPPTGSTRHQREEGAGHRDLRPRLDPERSGDHHPAVGRYRPQHRPRPAQVHRRRDLRQDDAQYPGLRSGIPRGQGAGAQVG